MTSHKILLYVIAQVVKKKDKTNGQDYKWLFGTLQNTLFLTVFPGVVEWYDKPKVSHENLQICSPHLYVLQFL